MARAHGLARERAEVGADARLTSVGVVVTRAAFKETRDDVEGWLRARLESTELGKDAARWQRVSDVRREGDYSYTMRRYCGPGWALIGDAARFVDPIFSSGVNVALYSARGCAKAITALRRDGADEAAILARYEQSVRAASDVWHEFVSLYYALKPLFVIFGQRAEYRRQIVAIIQGTVWELAEVPVLAEMRKFLDKVREDEGHMLHKHLGRV